MTDKFHEIWEKVYQPLHDTWYGTPRIGTFCYHIPELTGPLWKPRREYEALEEENQKLRKLVQGMRYCIQHDYCGRMSPCGTDWTCPLFIDGEATCDDMLDELGFCDEHGNAI